MDLGEFEVPLNGMIAVMFPIYHNALIKTLLLGIRTIKSKLKKVND